MLSRAAVSVVIDTVLLEISGPELVLARDTVGTPYLCSLVKTDSDGDLFLAVQISSERLADLRSGRLDLRAVMTNPEMGLRYEGRFRRIEDKPTIHLTAIPEVPEAWLPRDGFFLSSFADHIDDAEVVREAITKNAAIVVCALDPPEARGLEPKINAERLVGCVKGFQSLVKHAMRKAIGRMTDARKLQIGGADAHVLQVLSFSPGSFRIHFQSKHSADLFGSSPVGMAMLKVDELMNLAEQPLTNALDVIRQNRGLVIGAYANVLRFVCDQSDPFEYRWADPGMTAPSGQRIEPLQAAALSAALDSEQELGVEEISFKGRFDKVHRTRGTWIVRDEEGEQRQGVLHEDNPDLLRGIVVETQLYVLACEERLAETAAGRQSTKLFLRSVQLAD